MNSLNLQMDRQDQTEWCWAAVSFSLDRFYDPATALSQCKVAAQVLGSNCCEDKAICNEPLDLAIVLREINRLEQEIRRPIDSDTLSDLIESKKPIAVGIAWFAGGAHFVVIDGWDKESNMVSVRDPDRTRGDTCIDLDEFTGNYANAGLWRFTYLTSNERA